MSNGIIDKIQSPNDLKKVPFEDLHQLCSEIREILIHTTAETGGHLSSNLGTVELTVALHRVFETPNDQIVWDVGHQCYTHKLLTGRKDTFYTLRQEDGISGFPKHNESVHDAFLAGHSSTSISVAYGLARAKKMNHDPYHVIAVIGDGAFTSGLAYEGINNAARNGDNLIVILNDNNMSISKNVGGLSKYLSKIRSRPFYFKTKDTLESFFNKIPFVGKPINQILTKAKRTIKTVVYGSNWFEDLGFCYLGPVDGHNLETMCDVLQRAKDIHRPVFLHIETKKGKGYPFAEENPAEFHGISGFDVDTGKMVKSESGSNFSNEFGKYLAELGEKDTRICAITAAMKYGTGLNYFYKAFKDSGRFFDVGIAEPHAVTFAGGLAANGMLPVFAVYSSFLQRCYDEVLHDLSIESQHVVIAIDRAGIVGNDGETHQGLFDVAILSSIPGITIYSPVTYQELFWSLNQCLYQHSKVCCIRYPRGEEIKLETTDFSPEQDFALSGNQLENMIVTYGRVTEEVYKAKALLEQEDIFASVLKLQRILPLPEGIFEIISKAKRLLFVEEGIKTGGIGQLLAARMLEQGNIPQRYYVAAVEEFIPQATVQRAIEKIGLDSKGIANLFKELLH